MKELFDTIWNMPAEELLSGIAHVLVYYVLAVVAVVVGGFMYLKRRMR